MNFTIDEVVAVESIISDSLRYDITVEDNHNFFANGILVHNCQNLTDKLIEHEDETFEVTVKMDGSSCTLYHYNGEVGVCSRNLELKINEENKDNSFVRLAQESRIFDFLPSLGNFAIQGELMGPGIQGNSENLKNHWLFVFDVYDIDNQKYLTSKERYDFCAQLSILENNTDMFDSTSKIILRHYHILKNITHIHQIETNYSIKGKTVKDLLEMAEGKSLANPDVEREGLVFKSNQSSFTFKAISNKFLLKQKD